MNNKRNLALLAGLLGLIVAIGGICRQIAKQRPRKQERLVDTSTLMFWPASASNWQDTILLDRDERRRRICYRESRYERYGIGSLHPFAALDRRLRDVIDARFKAWANKREYERRIRLTAD